MKRSELQESLSQLADRYHLRRVQTGKCYVGIHRGIIMDVSEWDGEIILKFSSPTANIGDQILEEFAGFAHYREVGLPSAWIKAMMERNDHGGEEASNHACYVRMYTWQLEKIATEKFMLIPQLIADDFHAHGGVELLPCIHCGEREATEVAMLNYAYAPMCAECWQSVQEQAVGHEIRTEQVVNWGPAFLALLGVVLLGALGWGLLQETEMWLGKSLGIFLFLIAFGWGAYACDIVPRFSIGVTFGLRVLIALSVLGGLLLGNAWGYYSLLRQNGQPVVFSEAIELYFRVQLWKPDELPYLASGCLGAWLGFSLLRSSGRIKVQ
ncbi:MAG TPA: hypothetical protein PLN21_11280 [Gemmatales bacterium]|nr:hypothetical protein [Gemmatales bacterium]